MFEKFFSILKKLKIYCIYTYVLRNNIITWIVILYIISWLFYINIGIYLILKEYLDTNLVIIEDAKAYLNIIMKHKGREKILKSYPIEVMVVYDRSFYNKNVRLLEQLIQSQFKGIKIEVKIHEVLMWSPDILHPKDGQSGWLKGESFSGWRRKTNFKFFFFLQDAVGYELENIHKITSPLNKVLYKNSNQLQNNYFYHENHEVKLTLDMKTYKVREAFITEKTDDINLATNYYKQNFKRSPSLFIKTKYNQYQVIVIDIFDDYYTKIIKKKGISLRYLKKLRNNLDINLDKKWSISDQKYLKYFFYSK